MAKNMVGWYQRVETCGSVVSSCEGVVELDGERGVWVRSKAAGPESMRTSVLSDCVPE